MQEWNVCTMVKALSLLCFLVCSSSVAISMNFNTIGVIRPKDPRPFVGETLTLLCNLTKKDMDEDSSRLFFTRNGEKIPSQYVDTISSRSLRLRYPITIDDQGTYVCWLNRASGETLTVDAQFVQVDYRPSSVKNVTCVVQNWRNMTCTWDLGVPYKRMKNITVSLIWTISSIQRDCPNLTHTSCVWSGEYPNSTSKDGFKPFSSEDLFQRGNVYTMTVEVTNIVRNVSAKSYPPFEIKTRKLVKPDPAQYFRDTDKNSTCIKLAWNHSDKVRGKVAQVQYNDQWTREQWKNASWGLQYFKKGEVYATICGLTPYTDHTVRIGIWPADQDGKIIGFCSDFVYKTMFTEASVPEVGPETCMGCFTDVSNINYQSRNVRIYWKLIPPKLKYSPLLGYRVIDPATNGSCNVTDDKETSCMLVLQKNCSYMLQLYAVTKKNEQSRNFSTITIPSQTDQPAAPHSFVVETDRDWKGTFYLQWAAEPEETLRYLVVWCLGSRTTLACYTANDTANSPQTKNKNEPQWNEVSGNATHYDLSVTSDPSVTASQQEKYLVGLTRQVIRGGVVVGSGIVWARCIYIRNEAPSQEPVNVNFLTAQKVKSLLVKWDEPICDNSQPFNSHYVVYYCKTSGESNPCAGEWRKLNVTGKIADIDKLEPGATYSVNVSAVSQWGEGPQSDTITSNVSFDQPSTADTTSKLTMIGVILGVLVLVILVLVGICKFRRCYIKNLAKFVKSPTGPRAHSTDKALSKRPERQGPLPSPPGKTDGISTASGTKSTSTGYVSDMNHSGASNAQRNRSGKHKSITPETSLLGHENTDDDIRRRHRSGNSSTSERTKLLANEAQECPEKVTSKYASDSGAESRCSSDHDYASVDSGCASSVKSDTSPGPPLAQTAPACENCRPGDGYLPNDVKPSAASGEGKKGGSKSEKAALGFGPQPQQPIDYFKLSPAQTCPGDQPGVTSRPNAQIIVVNRATALAPMPYCHKPPEPDLSGRAVSATPYEPARGAAQFDDITLQVRPVQGKSGYVKNAGYPTLPLVSLGPIPSVPFFVPQSQANTPQGKAFSSGHTPYTQALSLHGNVNIPTTEKGSLPPANGSDSFAIGVRSFPCTSIGPKSAGSGYIQETELRALPTWGSISAQSADPITAHTSLSPASCAPPASWAAETTNLLNPPVHAATGTVHSSSYSMPKAVNSQANTDAAVLPMKSLCTPNLVSTVTGYLPHSMVEMNGTAGNRAGGISDNSRVHRPEQSEPIYPPPPPTPPPVGIQRTDVSNEPTGGEQAAK